MCPLRCVLSLTILMTTCLTGVCLYMYLSGWCSIACHWTSLSQRLRSSMAFGSRQSHYQFVDNICDSTERQLCNRAFWWIARRRMYYISGTYWHLTFITFPLPSVAFLYFRLIRTVALSCDIEMKLYYCSWSDTEGPFGRISVRVRWWCWCCCWSSRWK